MSRLRRLTPAELSDEQRELYDGITASRGGALRLEHDDGSLVGPFNAFLHVPKLGRKLSSLGASLRFMTSIERRLSEVAICTAGAHWRSDFEFWAHAPMAIEHGVGESVIAAMQAGDTPEFERDDERIVYQVATQLLVNRRVDDATYAAAEALLGEAGMVELAALVGYYCLISLTLNLFEVPLPGDTPPIWPS
jgi:4-carboxymuconolactone decarboxylase